MRQNWRKAKIRIFIWNGVDFTKITFIEGKFIAPTLNSRKMVLPLLQVFYSSSNLNFDYLNTKKKQPITNSLKE